MEAEGGNIVRFTYTGAEGERIPNEATHITISEDCTFVRARAFRYHRNIVELVCHNGVKRIKRHAFQNCLKLRRVIMPGVKIVEQHAFYLCRALWDVECGMLEVIKVGAFASCNSLRSINLPFARIVGERVLCGCKALTEVQFGRNLERIEDGAFADCTSLERITIPLKDGLFNEEDTFRGCESLEHVDLVGGEIHQTIAALHFQEWRNDMKEEIDSINRILPNTHPGYYINRYDEDDGDMAEAIRTWISSVLDKINHYKAEHVRILDEDIATTLQFVLPHDIAMNNVLSFLALPSHIFGVDGENHGFEIGDEEEEEDEDDEQEAQGVEQAIAYVRRHREEAEDY